MALRELTVRGTDGREQPLIIGAGLLSESLPEFVAGRGFTQVAVITNQTVAPLYGEALAARLPGAALIALLDGEQHKTLATVQAIYEALLAHHASRATLIVALGGGVIGDMAGYAAATFMRGLSLIQAPTSLLAMVDASLGGKVGVDLPQGKNLVGAFKDPLAVFADTSVLQTLPPVEFRCGLAEVVKAGLIADPALLDHLHRCGADPIDEIVARTAGVKIEIVARDPLEAGVRAHLNLGHTFAHALEQVSGYAWRHGEAVAVGLVAAARLSEQTRTCEAGLAARVEALLSSLGLPVRYSGFTPDDLWGAMQHDKKWQHGTARFVLLRDVGQPVIRDDVPRDRVLSVLQSLRSDQ